MPSKGWNWLSGGESILMLWKSARNPRTTCYWFLWRSCCSEDRGNLGIKITDLFFTDWVMTYFAVHMRGKMSGKIPTDPVLLPRAWCKQLFALPCAVKRLSHRRTSLCLSCEGNPRCTCALHLLEDAGTPSACPAQHSWCWLVTLAAGAPCRSGADQEW